MKNYYKINEISKLYGIGPDSLRYYEKLEILKPRRDTNGYRLYSLKDLYKLNIIRDLRSLDFSMQQIKEYLDEQSIDNTLSLLHQEQELLHERLRELKKREKIIKNRISCLQASQNIPAGRICVKFCPARYCVQLSEYITRDEEMDFLIKKLHKKHENKVHDLGSQTIGAFLSMPDLNRGISNVYTSVFFVLEAAHHTPDSCKKPHKPLDYDFILPAGEYLSYYYRGDYEQNAERIREVLGYAQTHHIRISGNPFETYEIDNRDTIRPEEYLTEIQIQIYSKGACNF